MKIQRRIGVNDYERTVMIKYLCNVLQLIRVVPPKSFGPLWMKDFFCCLILIFVMEVSHENMLKKGDRDG